MRPTRGAYLTVAVLLLAAMSLPAHARGAPSLLPDTTGGATDASVLTLDRIFTSREFVAERSSAARWVDMGEAYTTLEPASSAAGRVGALELVRTETHTGRRQVLVPARRLTPRDSLRPLIIEQYTWSADGRQLLLFTNSRRVWRRNTRGDYWVYRLADGSLTKLGAGCAPSTLMFAKFSPDGSRVAYVHENDLFVEDLATGRATQLTHDGSRTLINGTFDWVYEEEFDLRDGFRWSPDGSRIAYWQLDAAGVRDFLLINDTDSLYSFVTSVQYPKPGTTLSACRVGVVPVEGGSTTWFASEGDPRNEYIARMEWAANSSEIIFQQLNRLQNRLSIKRGNVHTGAVTTVLREADSAWIDVADDLRLLDGGRSFTWTSERSGWNHLYVFTRDGVLLREATSGAYDVVKLLAIDPGERWAYFLASPEDPGERFLFRVRLDRRGAAERLTPPDQPGTHSYDLSPDCRWAFHTCSRFGLPPVTELIELPSHTRQRTIADNAKLRKALGTLVRGEASFFRLDIGNGILLDGWQMLPPTFDPHQRYPVLVSVYGEPAAQTVMDQYGGSTYLWHLMLTQQGYIVMSFDNRGTPAPRGRAWRKCIYRQIGILASADQAAAMRAIRRKPYVDSARVGIWGWSGGGSMTLNMLFRYPELYQTGMAVAPVPDQRLYDAIYQERYMGLPDENPAGYRDGSPITFAAQLQGHLLVVHGTGDDNVHYQGTERLINALIAANKQFTMMAYPNRSHGIFEGRNTTRHLFGLLTRYVHEHLPPGPAPPDLVR